MTLREQLEQRERNTLSPNAARAHESRGRARPEPEHEYRTAFQRDRDRILHTKAFRRLKRKTQVFLAPEGDHYRTRLTHTLEVAQIARSAARALFLNEDLTEAIALGHDLGHTPFGHAGEAVLNEVYEPGFNHAEQSLRIVDKLESGRTGPGLNLTWEVRDGIANHSKRKIILLGERTQGTGTLEGDLVAVCDVIAYINHDVDDALRAGIVRPEQLPQEAIAVLGPNSSERINTMVIGLIEESRDSYIAIEPKVRAAIHGLRSYLCDHVYPCDPITMEIRKAKKVTHELYNYLLNHPTEESASGDPDDTIQRCTVDFVAGMTDYYALQLFERLFFPVAWQR